MEMRKPKIDVVVTNDGTVFRFMPNTKKAERWMKDCVQAEPWQWFGNSLVVDQRYSRGLAEAMQEAGLVLA
jgi:hypothetical protein